MERLGIDRSVDLARSDDAGQGGGETQPAGRLGIIKRLDAEPVAREHHPAALPLVDREGEHAFEAVHAIRSPGMVGLEDDLRVAA
jgi:hypothetical protein